MILTKAIIKKTYNINAESYKYSVYIPLLRKANDSEEDATLEATRINLSNIRDDLNVGDIVYVGFEDTRFGKPVIFGKLFCPTPSDITANDTVRTLTVTESATLPFNTTLGDISVADIEELDRKVNLKQDNIVFNPTVPSGVTPVNLNGIQTGDVYYNITGGSIDDYVDLTSPQRIGGAKTFTSTIYSDVADISLVGKQDRVGMRAYMNGTTSNAGQILITTDGTVSGSYRLSIQAYNKTKSTALGTTTYNTLRVGDTEGLTYKIGSNVLLNVTENSTTLYGSDDTPLNLRANHATWANIALFNSSGTRLGNIGANGNSPYWWAGSDGTSGQIALLSDIPSTSNFVTTNTTQTISGAKEYTSKPIFTNGIRFAPSSASAKYVDVVGAQYQGDYTLTLPNKDGVIATLDDIPSVYLSSASYNSSTRKLTITPHSSSAIEITFGSNAFNSTTIPTTYVSTVNGSTGAITNVAKTNVDNNFSVSQTFTSGSINLGVDGWKATLESSSSVMGKNHTYTFPDASGVLALTDDIPVVSTLSYATSANNKFIFNIPQSYNFTSGGGLGIFTFGNCMNYLSLYGLTSGTMYKTTGTFLYDSSGSAVTTTLNYRYTRSGNTNQLEIWSGNSSKSIVNDYTGYLFLINIK